MDYSFIIVLFLPWVINRIRSTSHKGIQRPKRPKTKADRAVTLLIGLAILWQVLCLTLYRPHNLLNNLNVTADMPSYILRNRFRDWFANIQSSSDPMELDTQEKLTALYESLKSNERRKIYLTFGETAFLSCKWCKEESDYFIWILPSIIASYSFMLGVLGFATATRRKQYWRLYGVSYLAISAFIEFIMFYSGSRDELLADIPAGEFDVMDRYRRYGFISLLVVISFINIGEDWTPKEILAGIHSSHEIILNRITGLRFARAAILGDTNLRREFFEYYKEQEAHTELINSNEEYKEARDKVMTKFNIEKMMKDAQVFATEAIKAAASQNTPSSSSSSSDDANRLKQE